MQEKMLIGLNVLDPVVDHCKWLAIGLFDMLCGIFGFLAHVHHNRFFGFKGGCELFCGDAVDGGNTFAANIALKWNEAGPNGLSALIASGLVLFIITLVVNMIARLIVARRKEYSGANS